MNTLTRRLIVALALVTPLALILPASTSSASDPHIAPAFHQFSFANGDSAQNVCSYATTPGQAHCNADLRTGNYAKPPRVRATGSSATLGYNGAYSPAYLQSAYNVAAADAARNGGAGQVVAIVDAYSSSSLNSDLAYYRSYFSLPACPSGTVSASNSSCVFEQVNQTGSSSPLPAANSGWALEISLDVEMVSAICPSCQILLVDATSPSIANLGTAVNTAVSLGANVVSNSYGGSEYASEASDAASYYTHPGVPIVVASGDSGYGVEFPAASGSVVAVGGTTLNQATATGTRNATETAWSGSGAGCSAYMPKPSWQTDTGCARRTVADVSAVANPSTGVWVYDTFGYSGFVIVGGTSVATPIISSIYALAGNPTGSSANPASCLYANASSLTPVTSGSDGSCGTYLCNAAFSQNGYNGPTGLGTPGGSPSSLAAFTAGPVVPAPPSSPRTLTATPSNSTVALSWLSPASSGTSPVTGYNVYVSPTSGGENTPINTSPVTSTNYSVSGLTNASTYYFTVRAINAVGLSPASNEATATPSPAAAPAAPRLSAGSVSRSSIRLSWTVPSAGSSPITGYDVYLASSSGTESAPLNTSPITGTSVSVTGLSSSTTYYFEVRAVNVVGLSPASNEVKVTTSRH